MIVQKLKTLFSKSKFNNILYKTIQTASFKTPSPNKMENNFGISSSLIKVIAATVSVDAITEENNKINLLSKLKGLKKFKLFEKYIKPDTIKKDIIVPKIPKVII